MAIVVIPTGCSREQLDILEMSHTSCSMGEIDMCVETGEYMTKRNVRIQWNSPLEIVA